MQIPNLSIYAKAKDVQSSETIPIDLFLDRVKDGYWQDIVLPIQALATKEERAIPKKLAPGVTIAGKFEKRADNALIKHSGFIAIDIDDLEAEGAVNEAKSLLCPDPHVYACFTSISGRGLCLLFKINPSKHKESFMGISEYLYNTYDIVVDSTCINLSRLRFVSYDPDLYRNEGATKWTKYPKTRAPKKIEKVIYAKNDFEDILNEIGRRGLNLCESYEEWLRIGFAFADQFGEVGRGYFHHVSQFSTKYSIRTCDKQYDNCLRAHGSGSKATIATFYYYCKQAGLETYSKRTKTIAYSAAQGKKGGLNAQQVAKNLAQFEGIQGADVQAIAQKVMEDNVELHEDGIIEQLELWLRQNYELRRNVITRMIEDSGKKLEEKDLNTIWVSASKVFDKVSFETLNRLINSNFVPDYNPFKEFIALNIERGKEAAAGTAPSAIDKLLSSIETPDPEYLQYFGKKWIVGIISAIHGEHSPLELVLVGNEHGTGKTYWFNKFLPTDLKEYFAQSDLDDGTDGEILMTKKLIILDDEMGGKNRKDSKRFKRLTSQQVFSIREPYGRAHADLMRLGVLAGTSNEDDIMDDPTGNRRIIPIKVLNILHSVYNSVDKTDVFMEAYHLWKSGFEWRVLSREDKLYLNKHIAIFEVASSEKELIMQFYEKGKLAMTASEIQFKINQKTGTKLLLKRIGMELKRLGFEQKIVYKEGGSTQRCWMVQEVSILGSTATSDLPFPPYEPTQPESQQQAQQAAKQPQQQEIKFNPQNDLRNEFF